MGLGCVTLAIVDFFSKYRRMNCFCSWLYVRIRGVQGGGEKGDSPPPKFSKTKKFLSKTSLYGLKYYKIVKKWSENASSKV